MNGRISRLLRKQSSFNPNAARDSSEYTEKKFNKMEINAQGLAVPVVMITRSLAHDSARKKYQDLKELYRLAKV